MLYIISTPIGNLGDISLRAIETLKSVDYILCEDTRHSGILLKHLNIRSHLKSYHKFSEASQAERILEDLENGKNIALISDSGTPCISDPGYRLVHDCRSRDIPVFSIPGACALITALSCSGLPTDRFQFIGFLSKKESERKQTLLDAIMYPGTSVAYESPKRLLTTLQDINTLSSNILVSVARELTKLHEEVITKTANEQLLLWKERSSIKGEIVLLISGNSSSSKEHWHKFSPLEHVQFLEKTYELSKKDAIKLAAELRGVPKRDVYNQVS